MSLCCQSVRSKFSRLGNIASIVAITSIEDLEDYDLLLSPTEPVTSSNAAKKLSQAEAVQLLKVRSNQFAAQTRVCCWLALCDASRVLVDCWVWLWLMALQKRVDFPKAELQKLI